ncbi:hypothetical protein [Nocardia sienata]|uniref:hypothetical protein n=1 Tax=Nocardia sienata TaxID=248552 RepID=UPI0007A486B3|nr:hypothetical protein [Nocardia sienata]
MVTVPPHAIPHTELVAAVRDRYERVFPPGSPRAHAVERALTMAGRLAIEVHPMHLRTEEIMGMRGFAARNAAAWDAFHAYAVPAAWAALDSVGRSGTDIDVVILESSTLMSMPSPISALTQALGLRRDCAALPVAGMGCRGGAHAITLAHTWLRAHPGDTVLIVTADTASPHFHVETELDEAGLVGNIVSSTLFSDAAAAAVVSASLEEGIELLDIARYEVPGTSDAITWVVTDEGPRFRLTTDAVRSIPAVAPTLRALLGRQGWAAADLAVCALHAGGNNIIRDVQQTLGLDAHQVAPAWQSLTRGNLMSSAVLDAIALIAADPALRPARGAPLLGAGFGPGFGTDAFVGRALLPAARPDAVDRTTVVRGDVVVG